MELKKQEYPVLCKKSSAQSQITCDEEVNVPDSCPDVGRMIQKKGSVQIKDVQVGDDAVLLSGQLVFCLLYVTDDEERSIKSFTGQIPVEETIRLEGVHEGDKIRLKWELEDLTLRLIHPRKLGIQAVISFRADVQEKCTLLLPLDVVKEEGLSCRTQKEAILGLKVHRKETIHLKEELLLPSNKQEIEQVLWQEIEVRGLKFRCMEGEIAYTGELFVFLLYTGDDPLSPPEWIEQVIPVNGTLPCEACHADHLPDIAVRLVQEEIHIQPDTNGEERLLQAEAVLETEICLQKEEEFSLLMDVCDPVRECQPVTEATVIEHLLVRNEAKCRVSDRVDTGEAQGKILQICHSNARLRVDECHVTPTGLEVEGILKVRILYIVSDDEMPFYAMETVLPFGQLIEVPDMRGEIGYELQTDLEQLSTTMADSHEIEIRAMISCSALVVQKKEIPLLREMETKPLDMEKIRTLPGIVCCRIGPEDTLWDLAKTYYTTVDEIMVLNELQGEPEPGQTLFLVKKVES